MLAGALGKHLDSLLTSEFSPVRTTAMDLARQAKVPIANETLVIVFNNAEATASLRSAALRLLASQKAPELAALVSSALYDKKDEVKTTALELLTETDPDKALSEIERRLAGKDSVAVKQQAIRSLPVAGGLAKMKSLLADLEAGKIEPALQLDVYEAAKLEPFAADPDISAIIAAMEAKWQAVMVTYPLAPYLIALEGGDAVRGKSVLLNHPAGQCSACHKIADGKGSDVGPNLKDIGAKKDRKYILEGLVDPQAVVASGYGNIAITLTDGSSVAGQFRSEKDGKVIVRDPEGKETSVPVDKIKERSPVISTMPPMGFILQKSEIRDVVAYLAGLKGK